MFHIYYSLDHLHNLSVASEPMTFQKHKEVYSRTHQCTKHIHICPHLVTCSAHNSRRNHNSGSHSFDSRQEVFYEKDFDNQTISKGRARAKKDRARLETTIQARTRQDKTRQNTRQSKVRPVKTRPRQDRTKSRLAEARRDKLTQVVTDKTDQTDRKW